MTPPAYDPYLPDAAARVSSTQTTSAVSAASAQAGAAQVSDPTTAMINSAPEPSPQISVANGLQMGSMLPPNLPPHIVFAAQVVEQMYNAMQEEKKRCRQNFL